MPSISTVRLALLTALAVIALPVRAADPPAKPLTMQDVLAAAKPADWRPLDADNTLYLDLDAGRVVIELAPAFAPKHAANIRTLVHQGYFDGLAILRAHDNYVVQWGDPDAGGEAKAKPLGKAQAHLPAEFSVPYDTSLAFTRLPDGDLYAPEVGFSNGFPAARDPATHETWLAHCYAAVGVGRDVDETSGSGSELYVVIGHAPRHLDRNVTVVGRVVQGIELLSSLPRGSGALGFYEKREQTTPIRRLHLAADVPAKERVPLEVLRTDTATFTALVETRRNRRDEWYKRPAGRIELCNVPIPVRQHPADAAK